MHDIPTSQRSSGIHHNQVMVYKKLHIHATPPARHNVNLMSDGPLKHRSAVHIGKNNPINVKVFELQQTKL